MAMAADRSRKVVSTLAAQILAAAQLLDEDTDSKESSSSISTSSSSSSGSSSESETELSTRILPKSRIYFELIDEMDDQEFQYHFRMTRGTFHQLVHHVQNNLMEPTHGLTTRQKCLITLWYLANKSGYRVVSQKFGIAMSTAHKCVDIVTDILYRTSGEFIKFPTTDEMPDVARGFSRFGFPNVIGALDGTHISIHPPLDHKNDYCSRKMQFGINLTATCNAKCELTSVFSGYSAKVHDARVLRASPLYIKLETIPPKYHLLGDAAYGLHCGLMTPFKDRGNGFTDAQTLYNNKHSQTRMAIERCFGLLKGRWLKLSSLDSDMKSWNQTIVACCVLHNLCQSSQRFDEPEVLPPFNVPNGWTEQQKRQGLVEYLDV